jgi:hypothetical protein
MSFLRPYIECHTRRWWTIRELQLASSFVEETAYEEVRPLQIFVWLRCPKLGAISS